VLVLEASPRAGGCLRSLSREGFLLEEGPDAFLTSKPAILPLAEALKLQPIGTNPDRRRSFVVRAGRLLPVPEGFYLMAPASLSGLWSTSLFSIPGKLRMMMEPMIPARKEDAPDESLADFVRRRLGREALARFAQPMAGGIHTADPERLSMKAAFPQFLAMEREHGSLWKGLKHLPKGTSGPRYGLFASFAGGLQELVDALVAALPDGTLRTGTAVLRLARSGDAWTLTLADGSVLEADGVCIALGALAAARLLEDPDPVLSAQVAGIVCASTATLSLGFRRDQVTHALDGMGFVVPAAENLNLLSCSFSSSKFPGRAPEGHVLLRAFAGGALRPDVFDRPDAELIRAVREDLGRLLGISGEPILTHLKRHPHAMPQPHLGHLERVGRIEALEKALPGLALCGGYLRGAGIPDCVASGEAAAGRL